MDHKARSMPFVFQLQIFKSSVTIQWTMYLRNVQKFLTFHLVSISTPKAISEEKLNWNNTLMIYFANSKKVLEFYIPAGSWIVGKRKAVFLFTKDTFLHGYLSNETGAWLVCNGAVKTVFFYRVLTLKHDHFQSLCCFLRWWWQTLFFLKQLFENPYSSKPSSDYRN